MWLGGAAPGERGTFMQCGRVGLRPGRLPGERFSVTADGADGGCVCVCVWREGVRGGEGKGLILTDFVFGERNIR